MGNVIGSSAAITALLIAGPFASRSPEVRLSPRAQHLAPQLRRQLVTACADLAAQLGALGPSAWMIDARQTSSTDAFVARTGRARFEAAAVDARKVLWLQPSSALSRWPRLSEVLRHECVHLYLRSASIPPLPPALEEVVALGLSGQSSRIPRGPVLDAKALDVIVRRMERPTNRARYEQDLASLSSTFWPALSRLKPANLLRFLRVVGRDPRAWLQHPLDPRAPTITLGSALLKDARAHRAENARKD